MKTPLIHHFDRETGRYTGSSNAVICQISGDPLMPAWSTAVDLPAAVSAGHAAFFGVDADVWEVRELAALSPVIEALELTPAQRKSMLEAAVDLHLDGQAQALGYASIQTAVSYADEDAVPQFQREGRALRRWRSLVYVRCYELLAAFEAGEIAAPGVEELIGQLPAFEMPAEDAV